MDAADQKSTESEKPTFREIVERDAKGEASHEQSRYLRREDNLNAWREALGAMNSSIESQLATRKKHLGQRENLYERNRDNAEVQAAYLREKEQYELWREGVLTLKEAVEGRLSENKQLRAKRHERLMAGGNHRDLLIKAREFLATDAAIAYSYIPARDELLEEIDRGLYGKEEQETDA